MKFRTSYATGTAARSFSRDYKVGSVIGYEALDGTRRKVVVTEKISDIKNGRPGFDGYIVDQPENTVWGYDKQIIRVFRK